MPFLVYQEASFPNLILMILGAALCLLSYLLRLVAHISIYRRGINIIDFRFLLVVNFLGYLGWGYWCGADPVKMTIPSAVSMSAGVPLAAIGFCLFLYSEFKKHGVGEADRLVMTGIYSRIRHPMYVGLILLHVGFPLIFKSAIACLSTLLWAGIIVVWTHFEEKNLERHFGRRYGEYKKQTWF